MAGNFYRGFKIGLEEPYSWDDPEVITRKDQEIPSWLLRPHYSDPRFYRHQTWHAFLAAGSAMKISGFGAETVEGASYTYSDRLVGYEHWTEGAYDAARKEAGSESTARFFELLLQRVMDDPSLDLRHIVTGVNVGGDGSPYQALGYTTEREQA